MSNCLSIVLAAGEGTRMKSALPKVLHEVGGLSMVGHVLQTVAQSAQGSKDHAVVVVGREAQKVQEAAQAAFAGAQVVEQKERLGTGHAVLVAREAIAQGYDKILVLFGDTPLTTVSTLQRLKAEMDAGADVVVLGFQASDPTGYGRLVMNNGRLDAIVEHKDATEEQRQITFCNGGIMGFKGADALHMLDAISNDNAKGEYYLTDIAAIANKLGKKVVAMQAEFEEILGVNNRSELAEVEEIWQKRRRRELMLEGVSMQAPNTVYFNHDTKIDADVEIGANVVFGAGVSVQSGAKIMPFCHIEGAKIESGAQIGPFARLRPGAQLKAGSKVGNFCEVKKAIIGPAAKVNHLTYIGDAEIGSGANIGAGTITCNYDGMNKHLTQIGANAFIGSNSSLVAPVTIGEGGYIASGSVVVEDVPEGALAVARGRQVNKLQYGAKIRERTMAEKVRRSQAKK